MDVSGFNSANSASCSAQAGVSHVFLCRSKECFASIATVSQQGCLHLMYNLKIKVEMSMTFCPLRFASSNGWQMKVFSAESFLSETARVFVAPTFWCVCVCQMTSKCAVLFNMILLGACIDVEKYRYHWRRDDMEIQTAKSWVNLLWNCKSFILGASSKCWNWSPKSSFEDLW